MTRGCLLTLALAFLGAACLILALLIWEPEAVAAFFLVLGVSVGVTACLAMMAGR